MAFISGIVSLGSQISRWIDVKKSREFSEHHEVAKFLLDFYAAHISVDGCPLVGMITLPPEIIYVKAETKDADLLVEDSSISSCLSEHMYHATTREDTALGKICGDSLEEQSVSKTNSVTKVVNSNLTCVNVKNTEIYDEQKSSSPTPANEALLKDNALEIDEESDEQCEDLDEEADGDVTEQHNEEEQVQQRALESTQFRKNAAADLVEIHTYIETLHTEAENVSIQDTTVKSKTCTECDITFVSLQQLNKHLAKEHGDSTKVRVECEICGKTFSSVYYLKQHADTHDPANKQKCTTCHKEFASPLACQRHMITHSEKKKFDCDICDRSFSLKETYNEHRRIHTGDKPYKCSECGMTFAHRSSANKHLKRHTGERAFQCPHCPKAFPRSDKLQLHVRTHTGERPHVCPHCPKRFCQRGQLTVHIKTHTGERSYACTICSRTFTQKISVQKHMSTHTGINPYACSLCTRAFPRKDRLRDHMKIHQNHIITTNIDRYDPPCAPIQGPHSTILQPSPRYSPGVHGANTLAKLVHGANTDTGASQQMLYSDGKFSILNSNQSDISGEMIAIEIDASDAKSLALLSTIQGSQAGSGVVETELRDEDALAVLSNLASKQECRTPLRTQVIQVPHLAASNTHAIHATHATHLPQPAWQSNEQPQPAQVKNAPGMCLHQQPHNNAGQDHRKYNEPPRTHTTQIILEENTPVRNCTWRINGADMTVYN